MAPVVEDDCNSFFTCGQLNATLYNDCPDGYKFSGLIVRVTHALWNTHSP